MQELPGRQEMHLRLPPGVIVPPQVRVGAEVGIPALPHLYALFASGGPTMNRRDLERRSADELESQGYLIERAGMRASYRAGRFFPIHHDLWGGFDVLAWRDGELRFVQVTSTLSEEAGKDPTGVMGTRRRKLSKLPASPVGVHVEVWLYRKVGNRWTKAVYRRADDGSWPLLEGQMRLGAKP